MERTVLDNSEMGNYHKEDGGLQESQEVHAQMLKGQYNSS